MFENRLMAYSAAAGLGAFAFGTMAQAAIVYTNIPDQSLMTPSNPSEGGQEIALDIDGDSDIDYKIQFVNFGAAYAAIRGRNMDYNLNLTPLNKSASLYYIRSFDEGAEIGFNATTGVQSGAGDIMKPTSLYPSGFGRVETSYFGIALHENGSANYYFGWIRVQTVHILEPAPYGVPGGVTVYDFAYETTPNTPIIAGAPEPGCLALLATGLGAIGLRRRTA